ncbi:MAG: hypothetical protein M3211_03800 [Actinomycetota bacterium]|nr:hypothetical protein [Actinomycetota bacterium]
MKLYADDGARRSRQVAGDLLALVWIVLWVWLGTAVHDAVSALGGVGELVTDSGVSMAGHLGEAGERAAAVPLVGDELRGPFDSAAGAARTLAEAGRAQQETVAQIALLLGLTTALVPVALALVLWLPRRVAFVRRAHGAQRHLDAAEDLDLLALRAMASQPLHRLARVSDDPVGEWRRGDVVVIRRLAALELRDLGLRLPARLR